MILLLALPSALAQVVSAGATPELNVQTFRPSIDSHEFFRVIDSDLSGRGFAGRALASYTVAPLQYTAWDGTTTDLVSNLVQLDVIGAYTIGPFRLGVDLPVILRAFGGTDPSVTGFGDPGIDAKLRALDPAEKPVGLAFTARTAIPTSTAGGALGAAGPGVELLASVDRRFGDRVEGVLDVGVNLQPATEMENVTWGSTGVIQPGLAFSATDRAGLVGELYLSGLLGDLANENGRPAEALVGGWYRAGERRAVAIRPALGIGLGDAVTTPRFRAMLGVAWDPLEPAGPPDRDKDGIADDADGCPDVPEDLDAFEDSDGCAELARLTIRVVDSDGVPVDTAWTLGAGQTGRSGAAIELDAGPQQASALGVTTTVEVPKGGALDAVITVPAPRGTLSVQMIAKNTGGPILDGTWRAAGPTPVPTSPPGSVKARPGTYQLVGEAPGYRPAKATVELEKDGTATLVLEMIPARAEIKREKIEIKDSVYFETGKAIIKPESFALLDEVAEILRDHPELTKVRVEGNTDSRGDAKANLMLSQARAESVRTYLIGKGVSGDRLAAVGYGEGKPLVKEKTPADQAKNRRVDFFVLERSDGGAPGDVRTVPTPGDKPKER